jgi:prepilin-type N-terminal cleavage/methylation domain-containing protein
VNRSAGRFSPSRLRSRHRGYSLLEMTIVLSIGAGFLLAMTVAMHSHLLGLRTQTMAQRYQAMQSAAQRYLEAFNHLLIKLPVECAERIYRSGQALRAPEAISYGRCTLALDHEGRRTTVTNALQPLAHELKALDMLDAQGSTRIIMDHKSMVFLPNTASPDTLAPPDLVVRIRRLCESPGCPGPAVWESVVYNRQPFETIGGNWVLYSARSGLPAFRSAGQRCSDERRGASKRPTGYTAR